MPALGNNVYRVTVNVDGAPRSSDARGRLQRKMRDYRLPRGYAAKHATGIIAGKTFRSQFVAMFGTQLRYRSKTGANLDALDRIDAHQGIGQFRIQAIKYRLTQSGWNTLCHDGDFSANRILLAAELIHVGLKLRHLVRIGTEKSIFGYGIPAFERNLDRTQLAHIAADHDTLGLQVFAGNGTGRHAHGCFPGGRTPTTTVVAHTVFMVVGVIGMCRAEAVFDRRVVLGFLIGIANQQADWTAGGFALENAGEDFHFIRFLPLGCVPAGARLAAIQIALQITCVEFQPGRAPVDNSHQRRTMAFASSGNSKKSAKGVSGHARNLTSDDKGGQYTAPPPQVTACEAAVRLCFYQTEADMQAALDVILPTDMSGQLVLLLMLAALATSALTAAMGIGGGVLLLAIMALSMPPAAIIPVHGMVQLGSNANRALMTFKHINPGLILWFLPGVIIGAWLASRVLIALPLPLVQLCIAGFILLLCWGPAIPKVATGRIGTLAAAALTSFLSLFVGATGPLVAAFIKQQQAGERLSTVATFAAAMTLQHAPKAIVYGAAGFVFSEWLGLIVLMIGSGVLGTWAGLRILNRLSDQRFGRIFNLLLTLLAVRLIWQAAGNLWS